MVWDMKHRDWVFVKMINMKDKEAKTAVRNRQKLLRKFIDRAPPTDCTIKLNYQSLIEKYNKQVFGNSRSMKYLCQFCENVLKLKHTQSYELRQNIKSKMIENKEMLQWCERALKCIFYGVAEEHSVYVLSKILRLDEKMDEIINQFNRKTANKIKSLIKNSVDLKCVTKDEEITITVPFFPALPTSVTDIIKYLRMNTPSTKSIHIPTDIDNGRIFDPSKINENGFQGIEQARGAMMLFWLRFHGEVYQDINEKSKNRPLLHSKRAINVMLQEISTVTLNNFLNNQNSGNVCGTGSLGVERINRIVNSYRFNIGLKGLPLTYKLIKRMWFSINMLGFKWLLKNEEKLQHVMSVDDWTSIKLFVQSYVIPSFVDQDCLTVELNRNVKEKISQMANQWCLRDKLTFSKTPEWDWNNDMKLLVWLCDHEQGWQFTRDCEQELCQQFENLYEWDFLLPKVEAWGIHLGDTDESDDNDEFSMSNDSDN